MVRIKQQGQIRGGRREHAPSRPAVPSMAMQKIDECVRVHQTASHRKRMREQAHQVLDESVTFLSGEANDNTRDDVVDTNMHNCDNTEAIVGYEPNMELNENVSERLDGQEIEVRSEPNTIWSADAHENLRGGGKETNEDNCDNAEPTCRNEPIMDGRCKLLKSYEHHIGDLIMLGGNIKAHARKCDIFSYSLISKEAGLIHSRSLFGYFDSHEGKVLEMKQHTTKLREWNVNSECSAFQAVVKRSPLYCLVDSSFQNADKVLLSAFTERWQPETNTFHLPFGEMTITLEDVVHITRLPIMGLTVGRLKSVTKDDVVRWFEELLGIPEEYIREEMKFTNGKFVRLEWLRSSLEGTSNDEIPDTIDFAVRGYLLYLLGCTLFPDKSGTLVSMLYLDFLHDINAHDQFAWGAAALAYLYRQLGSASRKDAASISGYLTLMQVNWVPYRPYIEQQDNPCDIVWFSGCLRAIDITEPYHPDRVARQFGHKQLVPRDPLEPIECIRTKANFKVYDVKHDEPEMNYKRWEDHLIRVEIRGPMAVIPHDCSDDYETWFRTHSYPKLTSNKDSKDYDAVEPIPSMESRILSRVKETLQATLQQPHVNARRCKEVMKEVIDMLNSTMNAQMEDAQIDEAGEEPPSNHEM